LETLNLSNNKINVLPGKMKSLIGLKELILTNNNFSDAEKERIKLELSTVDIDF